MPASTSSNTIVGGPPLSTRRRASITRVSSPPDATFEQGPRVHARVGRRGGSRRRRPPAVVRVGRRRPRPGRRAARARRGAPRPGAASSGAAGPTRARAARRLGRRARERVGQRLGRTRSRLASTDAQLVDAVDRPRRRSSSDLGERRRRTCDAARPGAWRRARTSARRSSSGSIASATRRAARRSDVGQLGGDVAEPLGHDRANGRPIRRARATRGDGVGGAAVADRAAPCAPPPPRGGPTASASRSSSAVESLVLVRSPSRGRVDLVDLVAQQVDLPGPGAFVAAELVELGAGGRGTRASRQRSRTAVDAGEPVERVALVDGLQQRLLARAGRGARPAAARARPARPPSRARR